MATTASVKKKKKITLDDRMEVQAAPLREAGKNNDRSLLLSINEITHYFRNWTTGKGVLKKIYCLCKKRMLHIDPLESSCSQNQQYSGRTLRLNVLRKSSFLEKVAILKVTLASAIVYNCSSKVFTILYE